MGRCERMLMQMVDRVAVAHAWLVWRRGATLPRESVAAPEDDANVYPVW